MRSLAVILLAACAPTPAPTIAENQMQTADEHLEPAWTVGDRWTVRYRTRIPSMVKAPDPPPAFAEWDWVYEVVGRTADTVEISAYADEHEQWIWRFVFAPNGRLLRVRDPWFDAPFDSVVDEPTLALFDRGGSEGASPWPRFPLDVDFGLDDSSLRQRSQSHDASLQVVITRIGRSGGVDVIRTATERWDEGRPWWSTLRVETGYVGRTEPPEMQIEGEVIAWPAGTP